MTKEQKYIGQLNMKIFLTTCSQTVLGAKMKFMLSCKDAFHAYVFLLKTQEMSTGLFLKTASQFCKLGCNSMQIKSSSCEN